MELDLVYDSTCDVNSLNIQRNNFVDWSQLSHFRLNFLADHLSQASSCSAEFFDSIGLEVSTRDPVGRSAWPLTFEAADSCRGGTTL